MENVGIFSDHLEYISAIWKIFRSFDTFYGHLVHFMAIWHILWPFGSLVAIWYISPRFGIMCQEKSGRPVGRSWRRDSGTRLLRPPHC
jgi:hypothetical protein